MDCLWGILFRAKRLLGTNWEEKSTFFSLDLVFSASSLSSKHPELPAFHLTTQTSPFPTLSLNHLMKTQTTSKYLAPCLHSLINRLTICVLAFFFSASPCFLLTTSSSFFSSQLSIVSESSTSQSFSMGYEFKSLKCPTPSPVAHKNSSHWPFLYKDGALR